MIRISTCAAVALLAVGGCRSNAAGGRLPGDSGSAVPADNAAGANNARPSERPGRMGGTGDNGDQMPMSGLH